MAFNLISRGIHLEAFRLKLPCSSLPAWMSSKFTTLILDCGNRSERPLGWNLQNRHSLTVTVKNSQNKRLSLKLTPMTAAAGTHRMLFKTKRSNCQEKVESVCRLCVPEVSCDVFSTLRKARVWVVLFSDSLELRYQVFCYHVFCYQVNFGHRESPIERFTDVD